MLHRDVLHRQDRAVAYNATLLIGSLITGNSSSVADVNLREHITIAVSQRINHIFLKKSSQFFTKVIPRSDPESNPKAHSIVKYLYKSFSP